MKDYAMSFQEAVTALLGGKRVTRKAWRAEGRYRPYVYTRDGSVYIYFPGAKVDPWATFNVEDLAANDWEILPA